MFQWNPHLANGYQHMPIQEVLRLQLGDFILND